MASPSIPLATLNSNAGNTGNGQCNIAIPDYTTLRQQNLSKINEFYNKLLSSYTDNQTTYLNDSASSNVNDRTYANTTIKPKIENYNTQLINVSQSMIDNINQDTDLIMSQKNELQSKTLQIDTIMNNINMLKDKDNEMSVLSQARYDSLDSSKTGTYDMTFNTHIYIGINILMVLCIIGITIYIVFTNYNNTKNNSNRSLNNNIYRNISRT